MVRARYAKNGDFYIAYQMQGDRTIDLPLCGGAVTHLDEDREAGSDPSSTSEEIGV